MVRSTAWLALLLLVAVGPRVHADDAAVEESKLAAETRVAAEAWAKSCASPTADGSCAEDIVLKGDGTLRCGAKDAKLTVAVARKAAKVKEARKRLLKALAMWKAGPTAPDADAAAHAMFLAAESGYEAVLAIRWPAGLDFGDEGKKAKASEKKFLAFMSDTTAAVLNAKKGYLELFDDDDIKKAKSAFRVAATARIGQLYVHFAELMSLADLPRDIIELGSESATAYCGKLAEQATLLEAAAAKAFQLCVDEAAAMKVTGDWPSLCKAELARLGPTTP